MHVAASAAAPQRRMTIADRSSRAGDRPPSTTRIETPMTVTGIITAIVVGAIIGALARLVLPGRQNIPIWLTIVVGIVAAVIGTFLARAIGISTATSGIDWLELLVQLVVAVIGVALVAGIYSRRGVGQGDRR
jgi:uncharacterized membrane protein YeaQ/YmgE (transglycosylase-associated protein family)